MLLIFFFLLEITYVARFYFKSGRGGEKVKSLEFTIAAIATTSTFNVADDVNPWLCANAANNKMEVSSLIPDNIMPVNSLDVEGNTLICGTDGEAIHVVKNLPIR